MLRRLPCYQTPTWFIALLISSGVALATLDSQRAQQKAARRDQVNQRSNVSNLLLVSDKLNAPGQDSMFGDK